MTTSDNPPGEAGPSSVDAAIDDAIATFQGAANTIEFDRASQAQARVLSWLAARLARPVRMAVAGEFNTGKSALANRLLDLDALPTGAIMTTGLTTRLHYANDVELAGLTVDGVRVPLTADPSVVSSLARIDIGLPVSRLKRIEIVDIPGLGDTRAQNTSDLVVAHNPGLLLWCSAATQAAKESERRLWSALPPHLLRRAILVLTHADLVRAARDRERLLARITASHGDTFAAIGLVSSKPGLANDTAGYVELWAAIDELVDEMRIARLQFATAVAHRILKQCAAA